MNKKLASAILATSTLFGSQSLHAQTALLAPTISVKSATLGLVEISLSDKTAQGPHTPSRILSNYVAQVRWNQLGSSATNIATGALDNTTTNKLFTLPGMAPYTTNVIYGYAITTNGVPSPASAPLYYYTRGADIKAEISGYTVQTNAQGVKTFGVNVLADTILNNTNASGNFPTSGVIGLYSLGTPTATLNDSVLNHPWTAGTLVATVNVPTNNTFGAPFRSSLRLSVPGTNAMALFFLGKGINGTVLPSTINYTNANPKINW